MDDAQCCTTARRRTGAAGSSPADRWQRRWPTVLSTSASSVLVVSELAQRDVFRMPAAPALPGAAVARLPRGEFGVDELDADPFWRLVAAFLVECRRAQTRRAYFTDLKAS